MAQQKTEGIVLSSIKYGETSLITNIYTKGFGRQAYIIKGARKPKARMKANLFQPMVLLDMEVINKPGREIQMIKEATNSQPFMDIPFDMRKNTVCLFLAEVLTKTLREEDANDKLFDFIKEAVQFYDHATPFPVNFHLTFLMHLSRFLGFYPNDNFSEHEAYFNLREGIFVATKPINGHCLTRKESLDFHLLLNLGWEGEIHYSSTSMRQLLLNRIIEFYHHHLVQMGEIKSLEVLREVFK